MRNQGVTTTKQPHSNASSVLTEATKVNVFLTLEKRSEKKLPCGELEQGKEMETRGRREL